MQTVYVLVEEDYNDQSPEFTIIGVFDTPQKAFDGMVEYYRDFRIPYFKDVRDSGVEWIRNVLIEDSNNKILSYKVTLLSFQMNCI